MNTIKRIVSLFLVLLMILPAAVFADDTQPAVTDITPLTTPVAPPHPASLQTAPSTYHHIDYTLPEYVPDKIQPAGKSAYPRYYFGLEDGRVTPAKNQGNYGTCWAFSAIAAAETNLLAKGITYDYGKTPDVDTLDLSELHLAYFFYNSGPDPLGNTTGDVNAIIGNTYLMGGGNNLLTTFNVLNWRGPVNESVAPYTSITGDNHHLDSSLNWMSSAHCQNVYWVDMNNVELVKKMIMEYGCVVVGFSYNILYLDIDNWTYYCNIEDDMFGGGHSVCIVGWDDSIDTFNSFKAPMTPPPGAWICKNTWGPGWGHTKSGEEGYLYISYYDRGMKVESGVVFDYEDPDNYDNNYQYDGSSYVHSLSIPAQTADPTKLGNQYEVKASDYERLDAVGFAMESPNVNYSIQIYKKDSLETVPDDGVPLLSAPIMGKTDLTGFYTIPLDEELIFKKGDIYSIVISIWTKDDNAAVFVEDSSTEDDWIHTVNNCQPGQSYFAWGQNADWADLANYVFPLNMAYQQGYTLRIKGYTNNVVPVSLNLTGLTSDAESTYVRKDHPYTLTLTPESGRVLPDTVYVYGAESYTYDPETGVLDISNVLDSLNIYAIAGGDCVHDYSTWTIPASCTVNGYAVYTCMYCGDSYTETLPALGHDFGGWVVTKQPTPSETGTMRRGCRRCPVYEEEIIPATGAVDVSLDNYTLTLTNAANISAIRVAGGDLTTASEIKNAPGCININSSVIAAGTDENGNYNYELPDGGVWSVWYKRADGEQFIVSGLDNTVMTQTVDTYGVTMTVNNLYGVKDFFVAKGHYDTYREVKNAEGSFSVTSTKIAGAHSYTYGAAVGGPGEYTVCIRYDDANRADEFLYFNCEVTTPTVEVFGKNITVGNIDDIRVIRVAPGTFDNVNAIKNAQGCRNFTAGTIAKLGFTDALTVNNAANEDGTDTFYTVSIEYRNLYTEVHNITINKLMPEYAIENGVITFTNLEGLDVLRYAPGTYSTPADIKNAAGAQYVKGTNVTDGKVTLTDLDGVYTFLVQYTENSRNIFTVEF